MLLNVPVGVGGARAGEGAGEVVGFILIFFCKPDVTPSSLHFQKDLQIRWPVDGNHRVCNFVNWMIHIRFTKLQTE